MHVFVKRMEGRVRQPCLIKMQGIHPTVEHVFNHFDVVDDAVIGALRQRHNAGYGVFIFNKGVGIDFLFDAGPLKLFFWNGANNAQMITRWHQENRNRAHHGDRMNYRFMAIAVNQNNITWGNCGVPNNLIGCGCAIGYEKQVVGIENSGSIALTCQHWAGVIQ